MGTSTRSRRHDISRAGPRLGRRVGSLRGRLGRHRLVWLKLSRDWPVEEGGNRDHKEDDRNDSGKEPTLVFGTNFSHFGCERLDRLTEVSNVRSGVLARLFQSPR